MRISLLCVAVLLLSLVPSASASFLRSNDPSVSSNPFNITFDTETHLVWLDWPDSPHVRFDDLPPLFAPGATYDGWRLATRDEIRTLFSHFGLPVDNFPSVSTLSDGGVSVSRAISFLGDTAGGTDAIPFLYGSVILGDPVPGASFPSHYVAEIDAQFSPSTTSATEFWRDDLSVNGDTRYALVRFALSVPEPSSFFLLGLAGFGILGLSSQRQRVEWVGS